MNSIKRFARKCMNFVGLDVTRLAPAPRSPYDALRISLVLDVGANIGQYARQVRDTGFRGRIVSFEPLPDAHRVLTENAKNDAEWMIHPRCAIGAAEGSTLINISRNSFSSSILPMLEQHIRSAPESVYVDKVETEMVSLDALFSTYFRGNDRVYLKVDTQGFERHVLAGATNSLRAISAVQLELSIVPLYEGQDLYGYFFSFLESNDFLLWSLQPGFFDPLTGQLLQFDAIFARRGDIPNEPRGDNSGPNASGAPR